mmetsp:Transcript_13372/g.15908  ORF Transcript_13372/g.15908 Transcript_13372/m.15908 type:complete len:108 (+) Transcript_13372:355-678(+)
MDIIAKPFLSCSTHHLAMNNTYLCQREGLHGPYFDGTYRMDSVEVNKKLHFVFEVATLYFEFFDMISCHVFGGGKSHTVVIGINNAFEAPENRLVPSIIRAFVRNRR